MNESLAEIATISLSMDITYVEDDAQTELILDEISTRGKRLKWRNRQSTIPYSWRTNRPTETTRCLWLKQCRYSSNNRRSLLNQGTLTNHLQGKRNSKFKGLFDKASKSSYEVYLTKQWMFVRQRPILFEHKECQTLDPATHRHRDIAKTKVVLSRFLDMAKQYPEYHRWACYRGQGNNLWCWYGFEHKVAFLRVPQN